MFQNCSPFKSAREKGNREKEKKIAELSRQLNLGHLKIKKARIVSCCSTSTTTRLRHNKVFLFYLHLPFLSLSLSLLFYIKKNFSLESILFCKSGKNKMKQKTKKNTKREPNSKLIKIT